MTEYIEPASNQPWGWVFAVVLVAIALGAGWILSRLVEHGEYERDEAEDIIENAEAIDALYRMFRASLEEGLARPVKREQAQRIRHTRLRKLRQQNALRRALEKQMDYARYQDTITTLTTLRQLNGVGLSRAIHEETPDNYRRREEAADARED